MTIDFTKCNMNKNEPYYIFKFDDGIERYIDYENIWYIIGYWKGKVKLLNVDKVTEINSISRWKLISVK